MELSRELNQPIAATTQADNQVHQARGGCSSVLVGCKRRLTKDIHFSVSSFSPGLCLCLCLCLFPRAPHYACMCGCNNGPQGPRAPPATHATDSHRSPRS